MTEAKEESFCNAHRHFFGEIISGCENLPTKVGSLDQSFTVLFYNVQIDENKMKKIRSFLPAMLKNEVPTLLDTFMIGLIGGIFGMNLLEILTVQPMTKDLEIKLSMM